MGGAIGKFCAETWGNLRSTDESQMRLSLHYVGATWEGDRICPCFHHLDPIAVGKCFERKYPDVSCDCPTHLQVIRVSV